MRLFTEFHDPGFAGLRTGDVVGAHVEGVGTAVTAFGIGLRSRQTHQVADFVNTDLELRSLGFREVQPVAVVDAGEVFPTGLQTQGVRGAQAARIVRLIGAGEVEVAVVAGLGGLVAAHLDRVFDQVGRSDHVFLVVEVNVTNGKVVRKEHDLVVWDALGDVVTALDDVDDPGFVLVGDRIVAGRAEVAVLFNDFTGDLHGFAGVVSAFGDRAAEEEADAAVDKLGVGVGEFGTVEGAAAAVRADDEAGTVREALVEARAGHVEHVGPIGVKRFRNVGNHGAARFGHERIGTRLMLLGRIEEFLMKHSSAGVFRMADHDATCFGHVLADDQRRAGQGTHRKRGESQTSGDCEDCLFELHDVLSLMTASKKFRLGALHRFHGN